MNKDLYDYLMEEEQQPFSHQKFETLKSTGRIAEFPLKWHLPTIIKDYTKNIESILNIGIHDEELYPEMMTSKKLKQTNNDLSEELNGFDAIINRHQVYDIKQIADQLNEKGLFITQQIGGLNNGELHLWLNIEPGEFSNWSLRKATKELKEAGFEMEVAIDDINLIRFYDMEALFYYLKSPNSQIPTFSVEKDYHRLEMMNQFIQEKGYLDLTRHQFLMVARKKPEIEAS